MLVFLAGERSELHYSTSTGKWALLSFEKPRDKEIFWKLKYNKYINFGNLYITEIFCQKWEI